MRIERKREREGELKGDGKKGYSNEEENVSKDRGKGSSLQCIKYHLTEAWIANCYYPGDNKTVTIFADSERADCD